MTRTLDGPAGHMVVDDKGGLCFERAGKTVLQTAVVPAWGEAYGVEFLAQGLRDIEQREGSLVLHYNTRPNDVMLTLEAEVTDSGFRLLISGLPGLPLAGIRLLLQPGGPWFGLGERVIQPWPLETMQIISEPLMAYDHGRDGTLNISTPLLLGASGVGLLLEETAGDMQVTLNRGQDGLLRLGVHAPEIPFGAGFDVPVIGQGPRMAINVLLANDIKAVWYQAIQFLGHPASAPPEELWTAPIWTTWARYKMGVDQAAVVQFADEIVRQSYPHCVMEIDDRWQKAYGDLQFDPVKFPDPKAMVDELHAQGFRVTLWVPPFFDPKSATFATAAKQQFLVRHPLTGEPYLTRWWQGFGGLLDMSSASALAWWYAGLQRLQTEYGVDGFKFDGGESNFVPPEGLLALPINRRAYPDRYVEFVAEHFQWTEVRTGWRSQRQGLLFRQWDKQSRWGLDNGLHSVLTQALALSMIGYPFILPDMIGGNAYADEVPDRELLIRWTELSALLPAMQFSIAPWSYDAETSAICRRWAEFHGEIAPYIGVLIDQTLHDGTPLVRPLFWHAPDDPLTYTINDQFMLGDLLLVAPVLQSGATTRDVYLPNGRWRERYPDGRRGTVVTGPGVLHNYPAPLEHMPLFERIDGEQL